MSTSIFQGNFQLVWNSTSLDALKTCPRKYQYSILQSYSTGAENIHIHFGLTYHKAIELFHFAKAEGKSFDEAQLVAVRYAMLNARSELLEQSGHEKARAKSKPNLIRSIIWYLEEFKEESIQTLILSSGAPAVEITFAVETEIQSSLGVPILLAGHIDRIGSFGPDLYYTDLKTTGSQLGEHYFQNYSPHNQMSCYHFAGKIHSNLPLKGGIIDAVQVMVNGSRFQRGMISRTPDTMEEWHDDLSFWLAQADLFATRDYWPMNDTSCRMCDFKTICALDPKVRQSYLKSFPKRIVNPLEIRT